MRSFNSYIIKMKSLMWIRMWWALIFWTILTSMATMSCASAADYTDRQVSKAVESLVSSRGTRWDRKPTLERIDAVLPTAIERFAWRESAIKILSQIQKAVTDKLSICVSDTPEQAFSTFNLATDTSMRSIELNEVLSGGPAKDGIPALNNPKFVSISEANSENYLTDVSEGIVIKWWNVVKFYPYNILNRHEIVNDTVGGEAVAVTFCPLCGTAIAFNREFDGQPVTFWVSGQLYNSNLLMYDNISESLRSQAIGKAVVWYYTDFQLEYVDSDVLTYNEFTNQYPSGLVLSSDTGHERKYGLQSPYGDYDTNDDLYFPVSNIDSSLPKKTLIFVVNDIEENKSIGFIKDALKETETASIDADGVTYTASYNSGEVEILRNWVKLHSFNQMRFSWTAHESYPRYLWGQEVFKEMMKNLAKS